MGGGGALKAKHYYFCGGWRGCFFFFFQSSGQLAFVKMYNFLQVVVLLKKAVTSCSNGICWNEKKVPTFRRGRSRKNELCECHGGGVD